MNIIPLIFILVLVILIYLVYRRTSKESFIPDLSSLIRDQKNDTHQNYNTLMNIDNICQSGLSITHILQGRTHFVLRNGRPLDKIHINDKIELPYHWTGVDLLAKHTNNKLFVIKDANVYFIDDFNTSYEISDLYPNIESKKYKGIIQYGNQTLFYYKDKVITYNNTNKTSKITSLPRDIPKDYSRVFQFYLEPEPVIIFIRNGHYFRFNPVTETVINKVGIKFNGYFPVKSKLIHFSSLGNKGLFGPRSNDILKTKEDVVIRDGIQTLTITEKEEGTYRMEVIGAGQKNGGFGARVFTTLVLKKGDNLEVAIGQSGTRLPTQETHDESIKNNLNTIASASGSGATSVKLNNKIIAIAGGGGGFSSGLLFAPENCHASLLSKPMPSVVSIPIKKIIFTTPPRMFTVTETGKQTPFTKKYDIEYIFKEPLLDYNINYDQGKNDEVTVVDVNDNKIEISRLITRLTPHFVLTQALKYTPLSLRNCIEPIKNSLCREGNSLNSNANGNVNATGSMEKIPGNVIVYGGFNGGGVASMNIKTAVPHCGGGGGALGGNSALNDFSLDNTGNSHSVVSTPDNNLVIDNKIKIHTPVTIASGGSSFIIDNQNQNQNHNQNFSSKFNDTNGMVLLIKHGEYYTEDSESESLDIETPGHQMRSRDYLLSHYKGSLSKNRVVNKVVLDKDFNFNQLRVKMLFNLDDITTTNLNSATVGQFIELQPMFFVVNKGQLLRYNLPNDNALLDTIIPRNILHDTEFNEELEKDPNKLSAILTEDLYRTKLSESGKVDINNDTIEYNNFYQVKDNRHSPTELYFIIDTPIIGIKYDLLTIQCNNEATDSYDYLFNKILKKRD